MMTDTEITALAREYAEEEGKHDIEQGFGEAFAKDMLEFNEKEFKSVLEFLLRRYCLVEKEAVRKEYQEATAHVEEAIKSKSPLSEACGKGKRLAILSLFPEIAKEVEP